ncbi:MAG: hypothetical protein JWR15_4348, partial [Prosthecobacter sp.]|nr:hypothetical protein [Prosthecobacter sp.]
MGLSMRSRPGSKPEILKLAAGRSFTLYRPMDETDFNEWHLRLDVLVPALELCQEKWKALPACTEVESAAAIPLVPLSVTA